MELSTDIKRSINNSVLCWLATASTENMPNVSPKEIFNYYKTDKIIVANIASPKTVQNIQQNAKVCVSFIDILVQKGFQLKGTARIVDQSDPEFVAMEKILVVMTGGNFPFSTITEITIETAKPIIAPKYRLYPNTTEKAQIESAKKTYGF